MVAPQRSPYQRVEMRGLVWEGHNHHLQQGLVRNADQELNMVLGVFTTYGYNVKVMPIPKDPRIRSEFPVFLQNKLSSFATPSTLIILYYQGHGVLDRHGHLVLSNGNGQHMHWSEVANAIINARCDVLAILNCCHAGAALRSRVLSRPNYENHLKQVMMAVPAHLESNWGLAAGFAACLEQALRDRRNNWEVTFKGTPHHWVQAINRIMEKKTNVRHALVGVDNLIRPPANVAERPIVLGPRTVC
jgi:hypothetical protein